MKPDLTAVGHATPAVPPVRICHEPENRKSYDSDSPHYSLRIIGLFPEKTPAFYDFLPINSNFSAYVFSLHLVIHSRNYSPSLSANIFHINLLEDEVRTAAFVDDAEGLSVDRRDTGISGSAPFVQ